MEDIKISIITISYNQSKWLRSCLESVKCQKYSNLEHIIIDGGSTDGSIAILEEFSAQPLTYDLIWKSLPDDGPADALNKGFARATGDCYGFINSDDMLYSGVLGLIAGCFSKDFKGIIQGAGLIIDAQSHLVRPVPSIPFSAASFLAQKHVIFQPSMFFHREVFVSVGGFNPKNFTSWDAEFFVECCLRGHSVRACPKVLSLFRIHSESKSGSGCDSTKIIGDRGRMIEKCIQSGVMPEKFSVIRKVYGWLVSLPALALSSWKWAYVNGLSRSKRF